MMTVQLFGVVAELLDTDQLSCDLPSDTTVVQLRRHLLGLEPQLAGIQYAVALNHEISDDNATIPDRADIAVLPPFAGG